MLVRCFMKRLVVGAVLVGPMFGCSDPFYPPPSSSLHPPSSEGHEKSILHLAQSLAVALGEESVRAHLLAILHDSRAPEGKLPVRELLSHDKGRIIRDAATRHQSFTEVDLEKPWQRQGTLRCISQFLRIDFNGLAGPISSLRPPPTRKTHRLGSMFLAAG